MSLFIINNNDLANIDFPEVEALETRIEELEEKMNNIRPKLTWINNAGIMIQRINCTTASPFTCPCDGVVIISDSNANLSYNGTIISTSDDYVNGYLSVVDVKYGDTLTQCVGLFIPYIDEDE